MQFRHVFRTLWPALTYRTSVILSALVVGGLLGQPPRDLKRTAPPQMTDYPDFLAERNLKRFADPHTGKIPRGIRLAETEFAATIPRLGQPAISKSSQLVDPIPVSKGPIAQGGRTRALAIDVTDPSILLAAGVSGGIWKSEDRGEHWRRTLGKDQLPLIQCLVQDSRPGKENIWYACTGETIGSARRFDLSGDGIYRSVDGGESWDLIPSTSKHQPHVPYEAFDYVNAIALDPTVPDSDVAVVATQRGIIYTNDAFQTIRSTEAWGISSALIHHPKFGFLAVLDQNFKQIVVQSANGINWKQITPDGWSNGPGCAKIASGANHDAVYFLAYRGGNFATESTALKSAGNSYLLWRMDSDSAGALIWTDLSGQIPDDFRAQGCYDLAVGVDYSDPDFVFIGGVWFWRSTDGFRSDSLAKFAQRGFDGSWVHVDIHTFIFDRTDPNRMYVATDGGIYTNRYVRAPITDVVSPGCDSFQCLEEIESTWEPINHGYQTTQFYTACADPRFGETYAAGGMQDTGTWLVWRAEEDELGAGDGMHCAIKVGQDTLFISNQVGAVDRLYRTAGPHGSYYHHSRRVEPSAAVRGWFDPFAVRPETGEMLLADAGGGLWYNPSVLGDDAAALDAHWTKISLLNLGHIEAFDISWSDELHRVYTGSPWVLSRLDYDPADGSVSHVELPWPSGLATRSWISSIGADPLSPDSVLIAASNYGVRSVFLSTDAGESWRDVSGSLEASPDGSGPGPSVRSVAIVPVGGGERVFLAGTSVGVFLSDDLTVEEPVWRSIFTEDVGVAPVEMIDTRPSDGFVVVGTHGSGLYTFAIKLPPPRLTAPADSANWVDDDLMVLQWKGPVGASSYRIQLAHDSLFQNVEEDWTTTASESYVYVRPSDYFWRVASMSEEAVSAWSETRRFSFNPPMPGQVSLIYPSDGHDGEAAYATMLWQSCEGVETYHLEMALDSLFTNPVVSDSTLTDTTLTVDIPLDYGTTYFWRVRAGRSQVVTKSATWIWGPWSEKRAFTITLGTHASEDIAVPAVFALHQSYPNPFNLKTTIPFDLPKSCAVRLIVYDALGRVVGVMIDERRPAGTHTIGFDATGLPSGRYFYRLSTEDFAAVKSMLLSR